MRKQTRAIALLADYGSKASLSQCQQPLRISQHATFSAVHRQASWAAAKSRFQAAGLKPQNPLSSHQNCYSPQSSSPTSV